MNYYETSVANPLDFEKLRTKLYSIYESIAKTKPSQWSVCEEILNASNDQLLMFAYLNSVSLLDCYIQKPVVKGLKRGPRIK